MESEVKDGSCESTKITTIDRRILKPTKKILHIQRQRSQLQEDGRRDAIRIKSNAISAGWVTHKLKNNNTKDGLPLL